MASIDLIKASNGAGDAVQATVTSARVIGATTLKVNDVTNFPTGQFIGTTGTITGAGVFDPATLTVFTAHLSGADVEIDDIAPGYADLGNTNGQVLVIKPNTLWADNVADTLAVSHNADGTLKNKAVTLPKLNGGTTAGALLTDASGNVTGGKVTADKLDFATLTLGYAQITSNFTANSVAGDIDVTGLSTTVTIPSGGANIKITLWTQSLEGSNAGYFYRQAIKESGTTLATNQFKNQEGASSMTTLYRGFATAGVHTYRAVVNIGATANITVAANSTSPSFILVERS